jgi:sporulation protein YlmC with PRC-barrel domain
MLRRHVAPCIALAALIVAPALAEDKPDTQSTGVQFITEQSPDQWRASKLIGVNVAGPNDENIGGISDILLDHSGSAQAVVIGVGGFLGIGKKDVAVPYKTLKWVSHEEAAAAAASKAPPKQATGGAGAGGTITGTAPGATGTGATGPVAAPQPKTDASLGYPDHAVINMTKDELTKAPDFHYAGSSSATTK